VLTDGGGQEHFDFGGGFGGDQAALLLPVLQFHQGPAEDCGETLLFGTMIDSAMYARSETAGGPVEARAAAAGVPVFDRMAGGATRAW